MITYDSRLPFVLNTDKVHTGLRNTGKAHDLDRHGRTRLRNSAPLVVGHGPDPAILHLGYNGITLSQGPLLDDDRGYRASPPVELCFNDNSPRQPVRVGLKLQDIRLE